MYRINQFATYSKNKTYNLAINSPNKMAYMFLSYICICIIVLSSIVYNHFNPLNTNIAKFSTSLKPTNGYTIKYDTDIYLSFYIVLKLLQKTGIQIQKISLNKNKFNILLVANSHNKLLNFAMKHKMRIKLKSVQKVDKTYVMDINFAL
jgi:hypothetical protein